MENLSFWKHKRCIEALEKEFPEKFVYSIEIGSTNGISYFYEKETVCQLVEYFNSKYSIEVHEELHLILLFFRRG